MALMALTVSAKGVRSYWMWLPRSRLRKSLVRWTAVRSCQSVMGGLYLIFGGGVVGSLLDVISHAKAQRRKGGEGRVTGICGWVVFGGGGKVAKF